MKNLSTDLPMHVTINWMIKMLRNSHEHKIKCYTGIYFYVIITKRKKITEMHEHIYITSD